MPDKYLPIYEIQDFVEEQQQEQYFYMSRLRAHLQKHQFIQKPHKHNFYILLFITQGTGTHTIDFQEYPVTDNSVFFLTPGQVHSWQLSDATDGYILFFTPAYYLLSYSQQRLYRFPFFHSLLRVPYINLSDAEIKPMLQSIEVMYKEHVQSLLLKDELLRDYLDIVLIQLTRSYNAVYPDQRVPTGVLPQLQLLDALIDRYYKDHKPVSFYADMLHLTTKQLNDSSKRAYNKTITELIHSRILLEAKRLLVNSTLTIAQIAAELGYFDNAYFFRFFKKHTAQTPEQFRTTHI